MMRAETGWIRWGATDMFVPPVIHTSSGWVYRPDEARTPEQIARGTNKAFPRSGGYNAAADWFEDFLEQNLRARNWEVPSGIERPTLEPRYASDGLTVAFKVEPWGWVSLHLTINERSYSRYEDGSLNATYSMRYHESADWFVHRNLNRQNRGNMQAGTGLPSRDQAHKVVVEFMEDPWNSAAKHMDMQGLRRVLNPPIEDMMGLPYRHDLGDDYEHDTESIVSRANGSVKFWKKGEIQKTMAKEVNWNALQEILGAFNHLGYKVAVTKSHSWDNNIAHITGMEVHIPKDPAGRTEASRQTDHKFKFTSTGIDVTCGFEKDEAKWLERETRKAREAMSLMEKELGETTEFTIEL